MMKNCEGRECNPSPTFSTNCVSLRLFPGPLHKRTVDAADLGTTAEVLAAAKALYRLVEGRSGRQILDFGQLPKRDQNRYINEAFKAFNDARKEMKCGSERKS